MKFVVKTLQAAILLTLVSLLLGAAGWAQTEEQQSLGDAARKQKEKKGQEEQKGKKALTNEDLPQGSASSGSQSSSGAASSPESATGEQAGETASKEGEGKTSAAEGEEGSMTPAEQADEAKKKLEALTHDEESLKRGMSRMEEKLANETSESLRETYANALRHAQGNLADTQKKRAEAEKEAAAKEAAAKEAQKNQPQEQPPQ